MIYGSRLLNNEYSDSVEILYNNLCLECDNFDKIVNSIDILNENGFVLQESFIDKIKQGVKVVVGKLVKFLKGVVKFILDILKSIVGDFTGDNIKPVTIYKPTTEFLSMVEDKFVPRLKDIKTSLETVINITNLDEDNISNILYKLDDMLKDITNLLEPFGGVKANYIDNEKCFTKTRITSASELKKSAKICRDIANTSLNTVNDILKIADNIESNPNAIKWINSEGVDENSKQMVYSKLIPKIVYTIRETLLPLENIIKAFYKAGPIVIHKIA